MTTQFSTDAAKLLAGPARSESALNLDAAIKDFIDSLAVKASESDKAALDNLATAADLASLLIKGGASAPPPAGFLKSFANKHPISEWSFR